MTPEKLTDYDKKEIANFKRIGVSPDIICLRYQIKLNQLNKVLLEVEESRKNETTGNHKLNKEDIDIMLFFRKKGYTHQKIANLLNVHKTTVSKHLRENK